MRRGGDFHFCVRMESFLEKYGRKKTEKKPRRAAGHDGHTAEKPNPTLPVVFYGQNANCITYDTYDTYG